MTRLSEVAHYASEKISVESIKLPEYITTDNLLQNKQGKTIAENLPKQKVTKFEKGDILVANIRPYLKKIWQADSEGGASSDVLVLRPDENIDPFFLYYVLTQDAFFEYVMRGSKGTKMPRGDKSQIMDFILPDISMNEQVKIGEFLRNLDEKIDLNNQINSQLEAMAKTLYDYWFVQFDFPDENGKPYKSSGGKMVYNDQLKREIPEGWGVESLWESADFYNGLAMQKYRPKSENSPYLPVIKIREMMNGVSSSTEKARIDIPDEAKIKNGDILFSWSATLEVKLWEGEIGALNQHIFKVTSEKYAKSFIYYELKRYLKVFKKIAELRKTTMGHITQNHLKQAYIAVPPLKIMAKLDSNLNPIISQRLKLGKENQELMKLRDWLLPMLMNGQIHI
ncbi:restriction endonuclease subunit S [Streptococcus equinus]|uniref:Type I restriction enzyme, S subunit n=1 Tax=Streptococcus equinus TaxID=1335 RepID=A0AAE8L3P7_STREI|nr:restriction endonuclease subunit S [Streptococcus equinus]SDW61790.1 type I restriction enzyme, S subunit [Streptococcus equinus]